MKTSIYYGLVLIFLWISLARAQIQNQNNGLEGRHWQVKEDCHTTSYHPTTKTVKGLPTATVTTFPEKVYDCCKKDKKSSCCEKEKMDGGPKLEAQVIAAGVILIIFAAYLLVAGFLFFRITMIIAGLLLGCACAWICLQANEPVETYPNASSLYISICVGVGVLIAVIFVVFYKVAMFILCGMAGILVAIFICCWKEDFLIPSLARRSVLVFSLWLLFTLGVAFFEFATVIASMSFLGSYIFVVGLDLFIRTGFTLALETMMDFNIDRNRQSRFQINILQKRSTQLYYRPDWKSQLMMGAVLVLWILSMVWHVWSNKGNRFGLRIIRNSNDTLHKIK